MSEERNLLKFDFLKSCNLGQIQRIPIPGDASYRRYERVITENGNSFIFMDAPPEHEETIPFINVAKYLRDKNLSAPQIHHQDTQNGFLLLEDFGSNDYAKIISKNAKLALNVSETELYEAAIDVLIHLHKQSNHEIELLKYDETMLVKEALRFIEWYVTILNGEKLSKSLQDEFVIILKHLISTTRINDKVVVLRDYHANNLMWLEDRENINKVGLLDFQDAVLGSPVYDLVSLLEDARRDVGVELADMMINRYLKAFPEYSRKDFYADYAIYGIQRNLKIVGFCAAQAAKNKNPFYLSLLPRVWRYINHDLKHPLLMPLKSWLTKVMPSQMNKR